MNKNIMHVFAQYKEHEPVQIVATRSSLELLQKAINKVISSGMSSNSASITEELETSDGEQFNLRIVLRPQKEMEERTRLPYSLPGLPDKKEEI